MIFSGRTSNQQTQRLNDNNNINQQVRRNNHSSNDRRNQQNNGQNAQNNFYSNVFPTIGYQQDTPLNGHPSQESTNYF